MINAFLFLIFATGSAAYAAEAQLHEFEVEWEAKQDAVGYDLKLIPQDASKPTIETTTTKTVLKHNLEAGLYNIQVRAKYARGQNGNWSPPTPVKVLTIKVELTFPKDKSGVTVKTVKNAPVTFLWTEAQDADLYRLRYWSDQNLKPIVIETKKNSHTVALDMGPQYYWEVELITKAGVQHEKNSDTASFYLVSGTLAPVVISEIKIENDGAHVHWETVKDSESITGKLFYKPLLGDTWKAVLDSVELTGSVWEIKEPLIPGEYKIELTAQAKRHHHSLPSARTFFIKPKPPELQPIVQTDL